jgi:hypothetical protein
VGCVETQSKDEYIDELSDRTGQLARYVVLQYISLLQNDYVLTSGE